jgi:PhnB protein
MRLVAHLSFNGQCEQAFRFYERCFGGEIVTMMTHAAAPVTTHGGSESGPKIYHATLRIGDAELMGDDAPPDQYRKPEGFCVTIQIADVAEAERIFSALSENATVTMPMQETFWAARFGSLTDQFGVPWLINCENGGSEPDTK